MRRGGGAGRRGSEGQGHRGGHPSKGRNLRPDAGASISIAIGSAAEGVKLSKLRWLFEAFRFAQIVRCVSILVFSIRSIDPFVIAIRIAYPAPTPTRLPSMTLTHSIATWTSARERIPATSSPQRRGGAALATWPGPNGQAAQRATHLTSDVQLIPTHFLSRTCRLLLCRRHRQRRNFFLMSRARTCRGKRCCCAPVANSFAVGLRNSPLVSRLTVPREACGLVQDW